MGTLLKWLLGLVVVVGLGLAGLYFALQRPDIPWSALEAKYANAQSKFLDLSDGTHVHYRDQGNANGRTLVLLHGFGASLETWEPWVKALGPKYHLVSVDLPGFGLTRPPAKGESMAYPAFLDAFMDRLGLKRATIIGNSMGGGAAWQFALAYPERVDALVLVDAAGWRDQAPSGNGPIIFKLLANPIAARYIENLDNTALIRQGLQSAFHDRRFVTDAMVARYVDMSRAPGRRAALIKSFAAGGEETEATKDKLAKISAPTLILWGDHDNLINVADAQKFAAAIPDSKVVIYADVGHVPMEEAAGKSAGDLNAWLTTHTLAGAAIADLSAVKPKTKARP
jgi:pimeloyl-ACP methyl ester carboxylesterase